MSFRINEQPLITRAFEAIPPLEIQLVVRDLPLPYIARFLRFLAKHFEGSPHLELHMLWVLHLFSQHGRYLKNNAASLMPVLRALHRTLTNHYREMSTLYAFLPVCLLVALSVTYMLLSMPYSSRSTDPSKMKHTYNTLTRCSCDDNRFTLDYLVELAKREEPEPEPEPVPIVVDNGITDEQPKVIKPPTKKELAKLAKRKHRTSTDGTS